MVKKRGMNKAKEVKKSDQHERPNPRIADAAIGPIMVRALQVIGDKGEALRWLGTPVPALGYATPISLCGSADGQQAVLTVLGRLEHGVL